MSFCKHLVRYAVITGLVGGTAVLVAGPDRMGALVDTARGHVNSAIDRQIDDPIALRRQMRSLEGQYPKRIAEVKGDLAELRQQMAQLQREQEVSERVVSLASSDMDQLRGLIDRAEATHASLSAEGGAQVLRVVFNNEPIELKEAYGRATRIQQVQVAYTNRMNDIQRDVGYLTQQEERLAKLLDQLQTEYTEFQSQMWALDRQVDQISRNDRLIGMMQKRQQTLDEQSRYAAGSLDQLSARFADIRARQEAKLEALGTTTVTSNYEDRAKFDIDARKAWSTPTSDFKPIVKPSVIEIRPDDLPSRDESGSRPAPSAKAVHAPAKGPEVKPAAQLKPVAPLKPIAMK